MIVLASGSVARRQLLERAGLDFVVECVPVDEAAVKRGIAAETTDPAVAANALAELKALRVGPRHPGALVIGADQMLDCQGDWFDKPEDEPAARRQLMALAGRTHRLTSAVAVVKDGRVLWRHTEAAHLTMRSFSESFLDDYLAACGPAVLGAVGAYHLEGLGAQLFTAIEGDYFTILGLPLLPLLGFLRDHGEARS